MAWNGAGPGGHAMPVPGFGAQPPVSMGPPPNNFGTYLLVFLLHIAHLTLPAEKSGVENSEVFVSPSSEPH